MKFLAAKKHQFGTRLGSTRLGVEPLEDRRMLALTFNFEPVGNLDLMLSGSLGLPAQQLGNSVLQGFNDAASVWQKAFDDDVTLQFEIDFDNLGANILGGTFATNAQFTYSNVRSSLLSDASSAGDTLSSSSLQSSSDFDLFINRTLNSPHGSGSATPYLDNDGDANNTQINLTRANAKAAGLVSAHSTALDASIAFSNQYSWDFNASNGISGGAFDFVAVAAHEIGHALGFRSGVDILDINSPNPAGPTYYNDHQFTFVSGLDLFRFSSTSYGSGAGVIDWTADTRTKYFSIDGGATSLATFSTGENHGDGQQASHWKNGLSLGLMGPTLAPGVAGSISALDVTALDVIGWDRFAPSVTQVTIGGPNSLDGNNSPSDGRYDVPVGDGDQIRTVPVGGADTISISFNKDVLLDGSELSVYGEYTSANYTLVFVGYANRTATWELSSGVFPADQLVLTLSDDVEDAFGTPLDGEWTNPYSLTDTGTSVFPSGDGYAGGDFEFFVTILPGDFDSDNAVGPADSATLSINWAPVATNKKFIQGDTNGDGAVGPGDLATLSINWDPVGAFANWPSPSALRSSGGELAARTSAKDAIFAAMAAFDKAEEFQYGPIEKAFGRLLKRA